MFSKKNFFAPPPKTAIRWGGMFFGLFSMKFLRNSLKKNIKSISKT
jgi:hypothetical protein